MIGEAIVDAYTESEQAVGFHATVDTHLELPFETVVLGVAVIVKTIHVTTAGEIIALCYRGREQQAIPILDLALPDPLPAGWEWIEVSALAGTSVAGAAHLTPPAGAHNRPISAESKEKIESVLVPKLRVLLTPLPSNNEIHADAVVEGSVVIVDARTPTSPTKRVRLTARLVYAGTDTIEHAG